MDELSADRASYLSALAKQKDNLNRNNNTLVNPSVSSASSFGNSNDFNYYQNQANKKVASNVVSNVEVDNRNWWERTWDTISDFRNNITKGILNFIDGIGDFFGTITGSIADAAGNHQMAEDIKNNWINYDWVNPALNGISKVTGLFDGFQTRDVFTKEYWTENNVEKAKQNSFFANNEVYESISSGIGSVLPSIGLGIATGGLGTIAQGAITLGSLGASAAGNQSQEALQDGANYGQALGSGLISGSIEVGTELVVGKLFDKIINIGKPIKKTGLSVNGYQLGKKALEETAKMGFKGFTKNAIEEGLEEVVSELLSPLAKAVYDNKAFDSYTTSEGRKELIKNAGLAFVGGAVGSVIGSTISKGMAKSQLKNMEQIEAKFGGEKGVNLAMTFDKIGQLTKEQAIEFNKGNNGKQANLELIKENDTKLNTLYEQYNKELAEFQKTEPENFKKFATAMMDAVKSPKMSMKLSESDLMTPEEANKPKYFNSKGHTYVAMTDTNNFVKQTLDNINAKLSDNQYVEFPTNKNILEQRAFSEINNRVDPKLQAENLMNLLKESNIRERVNENGAYKVVGKIKDILTRKQLNTVKKALTQMLEHSKTNTPNKAMAKVIDRLTALVKENTSRIKSVHNIGKLKTSVNEIIKNNFQITDDSIAKVGLDFLFKPFVDLKFDSNGKGYKTNGLRENLITVLDYYNADKFNLTTDHVLSDKNTINIEFNPAIRSNLEQLLESLPAKNTTLNSEQLKLVEKTMRMIKKESIKARTREKAVITPYAKNTVEFINKHKNKNNVVSKFANLYKRTFMPAYMHNRSITGYNSSLSELVSTKLIKAQNEKTLYLGDFQSNLYDVIKKNNVKSDLGKMYEIKINNNSFELNGSELVNLYNNLHTKDNFDAINDSGLARTMNKELDSITRDYDFIKGKAKELMEIVDSKMTDGMKEVAKYLKGELNGSIKEKYKEWFKSKYGEYNYLNTVDDYWTLRRKGYGVSSVEKMVRAPKAFDNGKSRVNNINPVLIVDAFDSIGSYVNDLAMECYIKPIYRDILNILNNRYDGTDKVAKVIETTYGAKELETLTNSINDAVGLKSTKDGFFTKLTGKYAVAKLSMNISTMLKQFASIYTSNIPMSKSTKALINNVFQNKEYKAEFNKLVDEIGGLKYREGIEYAKGKVGAAEAGDVLGTQIKNKALNAITNIGMKGISKVDMFTIKTGVYSLMLIGENEGFKIGTQENINFVKENWTEFEASQISNNPMSKNAISRGEKGTLMKMIFGFMQGANRACLGSQFNKITTYLRNHNLNYDSIKSNYEEAKTNFDNVSQDYKNTQTELNDLFDKGDLNDPDILKEYERLENQLEKITEDLSKARQDYEECRLIRKDYNQYKIMGGDKIIFNLGLGLVAQGIFVTLVTELVKRITGKKDWDDWELGEILPSLGLNTAVSWIPFANAISSIIQYKEFSFGGAGLLSDMANIYKTASTYFTNPTEYNKGQFIKALFNGAGDLTGIPIQTLWDYVYGAIKPFNPDVALDMRSVLYPVTYNSMRNTVKTYIESNKLDKAKTTLIQMEERFNNIELSDTVAEEMINLTKAGYSVIPSVPNTTYTDKDGNTVNMTQNEVDSMSQFFIKSNDKLDLLLASKEYKSLNDENKAKTLNNIYSTYGKVGKAKALKDISNLSHVGKIVYATTNISKLPQMFAILTHLKTIEATKDKTKKELVVDYVNKLGNFTSAEKSILLYMFGYDLSSDALTKVKSYLNSKNVNNKIIKEILG